MSNSRRSLPAAAFLLTSLALAGSPARAQQDEAVLGPPQIRDFQLPGTRQTPPSTEQGPAEPRVQPVPPPRTQTPPATQPRAAPAQPAPARTAPAGPRPAAPSARPTAETPRPTGVAPASPPARSLPEPATGTAPPASTLPPLVEPGPAPVPAPAPATVPAPVGEDEGGSSFWLYALPLALIAVGGLLFLRRRRRAEAAAVEEATPAVAAPPPAPRPAPIPRPWLELEFKAQRASSTDAEAVVEFELMIENGGKSPARNIRINARMFAAGQEQDKEIGAFFRSKGEGRKTHVIPELGPGQRGLIEGNVTMPRGEMRALRVKDQLLFIPVVGVNLVYDWGDGRTGQTSKSYVIGRDLGDEHEKMGAFRLDLGPRIYRTVGQRPHSLARRV